MITLDDTVGGASSNTYVSLSYANNYFLGNILASNWTQSEVKSEALVHATTMLDNLVDWVGEADTLTQSLGWPRTLEDTTDYDDIIPEPVKRATCELALSLISSGSPITDSSIEEVKVGPIAVEFNGDSPDLLLPQMVRAILINFGNVKPFAGSSVQTPKLVRV